MRNLLSRALRSITTSQPLLFLTSFVLGALLALALKLHEGSLVAEEAGYKGEYDWAYERWLEGRGLASVPADPDLGRYGNRTARYSEDQLDPDSEAAFLFKEVKVFCLVFPTNAGVRGHSHMTLLKIKKILAIFRYLYLFVCYVCRPPLS